MYCSISAIFLLRNTLPISGDLLKKGEKNPSKSRGEVFMSERVKDI